VDKKVLQIQVFNSPAGLNDFLAKNPTWWFVQAVGAGAAVFYIAGTEVNKE
jgi:hypothetical protein